MSEEEPGNANTYELNFARDFHAVDVSHSVEQILHLHRHLLVLPDRQTDSHTHTINSRQRSANAGWAIKNRTCLSVDNSAMVTRRKAFNTSKVLECCRQKGPNLHSKSFEYSSPNSPKSPLPLKLGICLHSMCPSSLNSGTQCQKVQI